MPHLILEYSEPTTVDVHGLTQALHAEAMQIEAFPVGGLRVRAYPAEFARVGDGDDANMFLYLTVRIGHGRSETTKQEIGDRLFAVMKYWTEFQFDENQPTSLGLEIQEITPGSTWKQNNIHQILKDKT